MALEVFEQPAPICGRKAAEQYLNEQYSIFGTIQCFRHMNYLSRELPVNLTICRNKRRRNKRPSNALSW